jgi:hypothetical protein
MSVHVKHAKAFREHVQKSCTLELCAVCSMSKPADEVSKKAFDTIPNLSLLAATTESLTKCTIDGQEYVLQPAAVDGQEVSVCSECNADLKKKKVPLESLMSFDAGPLPEDLVPLTMLEENLVARYQVIRCGWD